MSEVREYDSQPRLSEFLGELSYSGYKDLGFDKILLVEGATEIKTIQQFLRKYQKDHTIIVLPLGGSQMINGSREVELEEIKRISNNISAIIDSERNTENDPLSSDREDFKLICENIGIECHVLKFRSTENYLSDQAVKSVKGVKYSALQPYQKLDELKYGWAKSENWRIARVMSKDELEATDLGKFILEL